MSVTRCCPFAWIVAFLVGGAGLAFVLMRGHNPVALAHKAPADNDPNPVKLGPGAAIGKRLFPDDNPWNQDISKELVDPNSAKLIASIGVDRPLHPDFGTVYQGAPSGIPYV